MGISRIQNPDRGSYEFSSKHGKLQVVRDGERRLACYGKEFLDLNRSKVSVHQTSYGFDSCYLTSEIGYNFDLSLLLDTKRARELFNKLTLIDRLNFGTPKGLT
jgi:hypothetical protein